MKLGGFSVTLGAVAALALLVVGASGTFAGPTPDSDSDGVKNLIDSCIDVPNGTNTQEVQVDSDRDGYGNQCDGDLNNSGATNVTDFILFAQSFGEDCGAVGSSGCADADYNADADMNSSGGVNVTDFVLFGGQFLLGVPGPSGLLCAANADSSAQQQARNAGSQSGKNPCEFHGTYRVKCSGDLLRNQLTGEPLRYIFNPAYAPVVPGHAGGHCVWGV
jgi:hypothetical protein